MRYDGEPIPESFFGDMPIGTAGATIQGAFGELARGMFEAEAKELYNFSENGQIFIGGAALFPFVDSLNFLRKQADGTRLKGPDGDGEYYAAMSGYDWRIEARIRTH